MIKHLNNTINLSDNIDFIRSLPDNSIDAIITDSPYGLGKEPDPSELIQSWLKSGYIEISGKGFMGKKWDSFVPQPALWKECYRVLKPGGHLLSFFGTRTYDWGTLAIRLAGFEIRDCIQWIYGTGFPKAKSTLKPANEPICVARKPGPMLMLGIDEARLPIDKDNDINYLDRQDKTRHKHGVSNNIFALGAHSGSYHHEGGRYPTNVILDDYTAELMDSQSGGRSQGNSKITPASSFFYVAKPSPAERKGMKHPTIKPVKLMEQLVKLYCPEGGICLDPHFGSGPTGEACIKTDRIFIGIDNDPDSIADANLRMSRIKTTLFNQPPATV